MKLKQSDRVRVYATLNGTCAETKGTVTRFRSDGMLYVNLDGRRGEIVAHPKQCRRLMNLRRIWTTTQDLAKPAGSGSFMNFPPVDRSSYTWVEFVEVRRKKK